MQRTCFPCALLNVGVSSRPTEPLKAIFYLAKFTPRGTEESEQDRSPVGPAGRSRRGTRAERSPTQKRKNPLTRRGFPWR